MIALKMIARQDRRGGRAQLHDVQHARPGKMPANIAGMIAKYFATSFAIENVVSAPRVMSSCLPMAHDLDELRRVGVEVDHVAGLLRGRRARVHRHADVGLRERRRVVRAVAGHRDEVAARLLRADQRDLVLGRGLGEVVVDAGLGRDGLGGERVVARDHHGADAHLAELARSDRRGRP